MQESFHFFHPGILKFIYTKQYPHESNGQNLAEIFLFLCQQRLFTSNFDHCFWQSITIYFRVFSILLFFRQIPDRVVHLLNISPSLAL